MIQQHAHNTQRPSLLAARRKVLAPPSLKLGSSEGTSPRRAKSSPFLSDASDSTECTPELRNTPFSTLYALGERLGSGSFSVVRRATRLADRKDVAVKCIAADDPEVRDMACTEYNLLKICSHPSIVSVLGLHESRFQLWLTMEWCSDGNVEQHVQSHGPFQHDHARQLFLQLVNGINHMHHKRIVHRDLKPDNLGLLQQAKVLKIIDFNSAKQIGDTSVRGVMLSNRGTQLFNAPEYRFGGLWNERVDIWACGLCFYFMLVGALPFCGDKCDAKVLLSGKLPKIDWHGIVMPIQNIIQQCLTVDMRDRPTAMELIQHRSLWPGTFENKSSNTTVGRSARNAWSLSGFLPVCGLIAMPPEHNFAQISRSNGGASSMLSPTGEGLSMSSVSSWRESRSALDALGKLENKRWERTTKAESTQESSPKGLHHRFFSTHGAKHDVQDEWFHL